jgi:hypothetical protein
MMAEEDFHRVIMRERKRTERTRKPWMLLLFDMGDSVPSEKNGEILARILAALSASTRDTDVTGWYRNNSVAGVVFSEFEFDDRDSILSTMITRVSETLRSKLTLEQFNQVNVSFHVFPEDLSPRNPLSSTDPDAPVLAPRKPKPHLRSGSAMAVPEPDDAQQVSSGNSFIRVPQLSIENSSTSGLPGQ